MKAFAREILNDPFAVILDTETTGMGGEDQIIQIGVLSTTGHVLLDCLIKPEVPISLGAKKVHGLDPLILSKGFGKADIYTAAHCLLRGRTVAVYNASFDQRMLIQTGFEWAARLTFVDVMGPYAEYYGEWSRRHGNYKYQSLVRACEQQGIKVEGQHTAIGDCRLTLALLEKIGEMGPLTQGRLI